MGKRKTSNKKQPTITEHALPLLKKPMEQLGKQWIDVPGNFWQLCCILPPLVRVTLRDEWRDPTPSSRARRGPHSGFSSRVAVYELSALVDLTYPSPRASPRARRPAPAKMLRLE